MAQSEVAEKQKNTRAGKAGGPPGKRRILINASMPGETRVAVTEGSQLIDLAIEREDVPEYRNSIFKAKVSSCKEELSAAFVSIGLEKDGFLPLRGERNGEADGEDADDKGSTPPRPEKLKVGDEVLVQLVHEQPGSGKGPLVRRNINLPGRMMVLYPQDGTVRRVSSHRSSNRNRMYDMLKTELKIPEGCGLLLRTRAARAPVEVVQEELDQLWALWQKIEQEAAACTAPRLMLLDGDLVTRTMRNHLKPSIDKVVVDSLDVHQSLLQLLGNQWPEYLEKLELHTDSIPLFDKYQIAQPIADLYKRKVALPSGGEIVIDRTEAMTVVDVNTKGSDRRDNSESIATQTNLEAVRELARQLVVRDIGGLIAVDFIDMDTDAERQEVEAATDNALTRDAAHTLRTDISSLGLMEISRQRMGVELARFGSVPCQHCESQGWVQDDYSYALSVLRAAQAEAVKRNAGSMQVEVPARIAALLSNELRSAVHKLELQCDCYLTLVANPYREGLFHDIRYKKRSETDGREPSGSLEPKPDKQINNQKRRQSRKLQEPAVSAAEMPGRKKQKQRGASGGGLFSWLGELFSPAQKPKPKQKQRRGGRGRSPSGRRRGGGGGRNRQSAPQAAGRRGQSSGASKKQS